MSILLRRKRWKNYDKGLFANPLIKNANKDLIQELESEQHNYIKFLSENYKN